jgi:hypothetical protein
MLTLGIFLIPLPVLVISGAIRPLEAEADFFMPEATPAAEVVEEVETGAWERRPVRPVEGGLMELVGDEGVADRRRD